MVSYLILSFIQQVDNLIELSASPNDYGVSDILERFCSNKLTFKDSFEIPTWIKV